ncbi:hypothetical protein Tco_0787504 [Tanacetum coccineum]
MDMDTIQLEDAVSTISGECLLEFTSEYGIPEDLHPELPGPEDTIMDFPEGKRISAALVIGTCRVDKGFAAHDVSHCEVNFQMQGTKTLEVSKFIDR